jgi:acyl carrier protein
LTTEVESKVRQVLGSVLNLAKRVERIGRDAPLLGALPELDSMAVASVLTALEEHFGFTIDDDEIDGSTFSTLGSLVQFVEDKLAR